MVGQTGILLVVDDDRLSRAVLTDQLELEGYTVVAAANGQIALDLLHTQPFDIVLLDLMMPEIDGFQVLKHMRADATLQHLPVIVISAVDELGAVVRSIHLGATDHLIKPCDLLLRARINACLAAKRLRDQDAEYMRQVNQLAGAAAELEAGTFAPDSIALVAARPDALGQLARVFQRMAHEVSARCRAPPAAERVSIRAAWQGYARTAQPIRGRRLLGAGAAALRRAQYDQRNARADPCSDGQLTEGRKMIDNVIAFASLMGKQTELHLEETNLALLVQNATQPLRRLAEGRGVRLSYDMAFRSRQYASTESRSARRSSTWFIMRSSLITSTEPCGSAANWLRTSWYLLLKIAGLASRHPTWTRSGRHLSRHPTISSVAWRG